MSFKKNLHDSKTLQQALNQVEKIRKSLPELGICDRGYRGVSKVGDTLIVTPKAPLKRDTPYQKRKKRLWFRRRAAIEPVIGHLKSDFRLGKNFLKGSVGDSINLMMAACAFNLKKWMAEAIRSLFFYFSRLFFAKKDRKITKINFFYQRFLDFAKNQNFEINFISSKFFLGSF